MYIYDYLYKEGLPTRNGNLKRYNIGVLESGNTENYITGTSTSSSKSSASPSACSSKQAAGEVMKAWYTQISGSSTASTLFSVPQLRKTVIDRLGPFQHFSPSSKLSATS
mmetsp:Transcript_2726/g.3882  ORF Transcript_2726/g.3882 Transcript_2726/m.3882 type:complete len:110 (+) Transcript_2726:146-475(+)